MGKAQDHYAKLKKKKARQKDYIPYGPTYTITLEKVKLVQESVLVSD